MGYLSPRHPLQEQVVDTFVSNDAFVVGGRGISVDNDEEGTSILLCTGANACGKVNSSVNDIFIVIS